jgi:hypothetical protein
MADEPHPDTEGALLDILQRLTSQQVSALERLLERDGQSCGISTQYTKSLADRGLLTLVEDELTHDTRLCEAGCGHVWYAIPAPVHTAYGAWSAQWEEGQAVPLTDIPSPHHDMSQRSAPWEDSGEAAAPREAPSAAPTRPLVTRHPSRPRFWVRFTLPGAGYFTYRGANYDRGQLIDLAGGPRDEQLERLGYVQRAPEGETYLQAACGACQAWFLNESFRDQHGRLRHRERFQDDLDIAAGMHGPAGGAALRDATGDADERRMQQEFPLYLERTKATLEG